MQSFCKNPVIFIPQNWQWKLFNSFTAERSGSNFKSVIFKHMFRLNFMSSSCETALRWMPKHLANEKSTSHQVMAWCRQATSHYLIRRWLKFLSPFGVAGPQWVNNTNLENPNRNAQHWVSWCIYVNMLLFFTIISACVPCMRTTTHCDHSDNFCFKVRCIVDDIIIWMTNPGLWKKKNIEMKLQNVFQYPFNANPILTSDQYFVIIAEADVLATNRIGQRWLES